MTHATDEVLAALALGDPDIDPAVLEHVDGCPVCSEEVSELTHVHALMQLESGLPAPHLDAPDPGVWQRIVAATSEAADGSGVAATPARTGDAGVSPQPMGVESTPRAASTPPGPESSPAAEVVPLNADAALTRAGRHASATSRNRAWWLLAAAAACILVGALVGRAVWTGEGPSASVVAATSLTTLDAAKQKEGTAQLLDSRGVSELRVDTATMPSTPGYVEVWLINTDGRRMVLLGVMSTTQAVFPVPPGAIAQGYIVVDLSREQFDDRPQHSGDSIMRGTLPV